ncbi:MAG: putative lipid II flippase FtsW [Solirubrobacterales bacterium]|nr:putative lipid II flippase FtsW [Solirubrobacterales bacterium]
MAGASRRAQPLEYNILLTAVLCLLAAGAVMVYSASSSRILLEGEGNGSSFLIKYVMYGGVGLVMMNVLARHGLALVLRYTNALLGGAFVLLVLVKTPLGVEINGAQRWLGFGPLQFQPSELMKLAMVLYAVKLLATKPRLVMEPRLLVPLGIVAGAACLLIGSQPDLGTALVICFTLIALLVVAGIPMRHLAIGVAALTVVVTLFAIIEPYRRARLTSFINPWADAGGDGFQSVQGQIALGSGGLLGRGLGESVQKAFFLPEAHTDFILAIIGEEVGVLGITALLFLYALIAYAGLRIAKAATSAYAKLLAAGLTAMVLCQASLNVFTVLGLAPLTGVPLPFISYGSTNLVVMLGAMGLLLNVASGGAAHLRLVATPSRPHAQGRDRSRGNSGTRRTGVGGSRRAAG